MAIAETIGRLGATLLAILHTRLELAAVEVEEEAQHLLRSLLLSLLALFLFSLAILMLAFFAVLLFWETHRIEAALGMAALFAVLGASISYKVQRGFRQKAPLLSCTLAELNKDIAFVKSARISDEQ